jgi:hypothetical protein
LDALAGLLWREQTFALDHRDGQATEMRAIAIGNRETRYLKSSSNGDHKAVRNRKIENKIRLKSR